MTLVYDLVRSDDELAQEFVGQAIKVLTVELGLASAFQVWFYANCNLARNHHVQRLGEKLTVFLYMRPNFSHCVASSDVVVQYMSVLTSIPLKKAWKLCRDSTEQADNNSDWN